MTKSPCVCNDTRLTQNSVNLIFNGVLQHLHRRHFLPHHHKECSQQSLITFHGILWKLKSLQSPNSYKYTVSQKITWCRIFAITSSTVNRF